MTRAEFVQPYKTRFEGKPIDVALWEAFWRVGWLNLHELEDFATRLMAKGFDSPSLSEIAAGLADSWTAKSLLDAAIRELGRVPMSQSEAGLLLARHIAAEVVSGELSPDSGAKLFAQMYVDLEFPGWLSELYRLEDYLDGCCGITTEECRERIVAESRKLLAGRESKLISAETETTTAEIMALDNQYVMHTYGRQPVVLVRGEGCFAYDAEGEEYLDLVAGIAVNGLGHCPPKVVEAICKQAGTLMHVSNLYYVPQQGELAKLLCEISGMSRAFFCNSGAEANEAAMKLAKKAAKVAGHTDKCEIVTAEKSFHGRTLAAITATGQPKYQKSFTPLVPGHKYIPYNDVEALKDIVTEKTCAIMMEPVQGESGVHLATKEFLQTARELADKFGAALIFDEVQTGLGRTGKMFGFENFGVVPDVMTLAKTLGAGFPIGACLARDKWADVFEPGDHAATFGGNPLACAAAIAAVTEIRDGGWVENSDQVGVYFRKQLATLPGVKEVRGLGLMNAAEFDKPIAKSAVAKGLEVGLILNATDESTLRFVPPLIITRELVDRAISALAQVLTWVRISES
ncbi:MAG: acetylornithine transaminase [Armatimonadota bacterium]